MASAGYSARVGCAAGGWSPPGASPCWGEGCLSLSELLSSARFFPSIQPKSEHSQLMQSHGLTLRGGAEAHISLWRATCKLAAGIFYGSKCLTFC